MSKKEIEITDPNQWFIEETLPDCGGYKVIFAGQSENSLTETVLEFMRMIRDKKNKGRTFEVWSQNYATTEQGYTGFMRFVKGQLILSGLANVTLDKKALGITTN